VRIADANGNLLDPISIAPTDTEAKQLHDFLEQLVVEKAFHAHVRGDSEASAPRDDRRGMRRIQRRSGQMGASPPR